MADSVRGRTTRRRGAMSGSQPLPYSRPENGPAANATSSTAVPQAGNAPGSSSGQMAAELVTQMERMGKITFLDQEDVVEIHLTTRKGKKYSLEQNIRGIIRSYGIYPAYGFIRIRGSEEDVFFSGKEIDRAFVEVPAESMEKSVLTFEIPQEVQFDLLCEVETKRMCAINVRPVEGAKFKPNLEWLREKDRELLRVKAAKQEARIKALEAKAKDAEKMMTCLVCADQKATYMFTPCNHIAACDRCADAFIKATPTPASHSVMINDTPIPPTLLEFLQGTVGSLGSVQQKTAKELRYKCMKCNQKAAFSKFYLP